MKSYRGVLLVVACVFFSCQVLWAQAAATAPAAAAGAAKAWPLWDGKEAQAAYAKRAGIKEAELTLKLDGNVSMRLVLIPAGKFRMGDPDANARPMTIAENPQHEVTITQPFYMGATEVTQDQYERVAGKNGNFKRAVKMDANTGIALALGEKVDYVAEPNLPVDYVDYAEAMDFCAALSKKTGKAVTLPTEAQWEHAYCAGTTTTYYWGNDGNAAAINQYAWFNNGGNAQYGDGVKPVALLKPNAWGLYDMAGNTGEFTLDYARKYTEEPQVDPVGPQTAGIKGGYFGNQRDWLNHYHRKGAGDVHYKMDIIKKWKGRFDGAGFRVIVPIDDTGAAKDSPRH